MEFLHNLALFATICLIGLVFFASKQKTVINAPNDGRTDRTLKRDPNRQWRGIEYCEILSSRNSVGWSKVFEFTAYNTVTLGCDREKWRDITPAYIRSAIDGGIIVRLNGPRGWAFDTVTSDSTLVDATITVINNMDMVVVGIVEATPYEIFMNLFYKQTTLYKERQVRRKTEYIFLKGSPLNYLRSPENKTYAMQSYGKFIYPVSEENLPTIGSLLKLPPGWTYNHIPALPHELRVKAENAIGIIVQDDFQNVYSRFDPNLLRLEEIPSQTSQQGDKIDIATSNPVSPAVVAQSEL
eukprot:gene8657-9369_t